MHRDFKPGNVVVEHDGTPKVIDFGHAIEEGVAVDAETDVAHDGETTTHEGRRLLRVGGTPGYMAPEQMRAEPVDARADIFAFCVSLYGALVGRLPYRAASFHALRRQKLAGKWVPPKVGDMRRHVWLAIRRGLAADPRQRWATMDDLLAALRRPSRRRYWVVGAAAVALAVVGSALATGGARHEPPTPAPPSVHASTGSCRGR